MAETSTTIRLIEASLGREDVADRANFRYSSSRSIRSFVRSFMLKYLTCNSEGTAFHGQRNFLPYLVKIVTF